MLSNSKFRQRIFKVICLVLACVLILNDLSFAASQNDQHLAAASRFNSILGQKRNKPFVEAATFMVISSIIGKYLRDGISQYTLIPCIKHRISKTELAWAREKDPLLAGCAIDELSFRADEKAFYLPLYRRDAQGKRVKAYVYTFLIEGGSTDTGWTIPLGNGTNVYVKVDVVPGYEPPVSRKQAVEKPQAAGSNVVAADRPSEPVTISAAGLQNEIAGIIASDGYPADKVNLRDLFAYVKAHNPGMVQLGTTEDEKLAIFCLAIWGGGQDTIRFSFKETVQPSEMQDLKQGLIADLTNDAKKTLDKLEHVVLRSDRRCAFAVAQYYGAGNTNIASLMTWSPQKARVAREFFGLCVEPEKRRFVGQWERDYARHLSGMSSRELQREWERVGTIAGYINDPLYLLSVNDCLSDTFQFLHPSSFYVFDTASDRAAVKHIVSYIAKTGILLEWASRHWGPKEAAGFSSLPRTITPSLSYIKETIFPRHLEDGSEVPFENRVACKVLSALTDADAETILGSKPEDKGPNVAEKEFNRQQARIFRDGGDGPEVAREMFAPESGPLRSAEEVSPEFIKKDKRGRIRAVKDRFGTVWEEYHYRTFRNVVKLRNLKTGKMDIKVRYPSGENAIEACKVMVKGKSAGSVDYYTDANTITTIRINDRDKGVGETVVNWFFKAAERRGASRAGISGVANPALDHIGRKLIKEPANMKPEEMDPAAVEYAVMGADFDPFRSSGSELGTVKVSDGKIVSFDLPAHLVPALDRGRVVVRDRTSGKEADVVILYNKQKRENIHGAPNPIFPVLHPDGAIEHRQEGGKADEISGSPTVDASSPITSATQEANKAEEYFSANGLTGYPALKKAFTSEVLAALIDDPALRPVFLQVLPQENMGPLEIDETITIAGKDVRDILEEHSVFLVGGADTAERLLREGHRIVVGVTDKPSSKTLIPVNKVANGRQAYFPLPDGTWLGIKGAGQFNSETEPPFYFRNQAGYPERWEALAWKQEAESAQEAARKLKGYNARFAQYLGYRRIYAAPDGKGGFNSTNELALDSGYRKFSEPVLIFKRVASPHRIMKIAQLLEADPGLKRLTGNISRSLAGYGHLPEGTVLSPDEMIVMAMREFGREEAIKQNLRMRKYTLHSQDLTFAGEEADNEEFCNLSSYHAYLMSRGLVSHNLDPLTIGNELYLPIEVHGLQEKLVTLIEMVTAARCSGSHDNEKDLFPEPLEALKAMFQGYFRGLDDTFLDSWTVENHSVDSEYWPVKVVTADKRIDILHPKYNGISAATDLKPFDQAAADEIEGMIQAWADEEAARRNAGASASVDGGMAAPQKVVTESVFGLGDFDPEHPLVKAGRIAGTNDYRNIGGVDLVEYAKKMRLEKGIKRIYFDLDLTVFRSKGYLSSSKWFEDVSREYGAEQAFKWWGTMGHESRQIKNGFFYRIMDPAIPDMIRELQKAGFEVVGLTARNFDKDEFRTKDILNKLDVWLNDVIYASGAPKKGEVLDSYETKKDGEPGKVASLFVEDSFKNLEMVLADRDHMYGIHYKGLAANDEDGWDYTTYMAKAEEAQAKGNTGHAFEYYFNAVVKILELKGISRETAYKELDKIYQKLRLMKDAKPAGYDRLFQIAEIARDGRSYLFHDAQARVLRPSVSGGAARTRPIAVTAEVESGSRTVKLRIKYTPVLKPDSKLWHRWTTKTPGPVTYTQEVGLLPTFTGVSGNSNALAMEFFRQLIITGILWKRSIREDLFFAIDGNYVRAYTGKAAAHNIPLSLKAQKIVDKLVRKTPERNAETYVSADVTGTGRKLVIRGAIEEKEAGSLARDLMRYRHAELEKLGNIEVIFARGDISVESDVKDERAAADVLDFIEGFYEIIAISDIHAAAKGPEDNFGSGKEEELIRLIDRAAARRSLIVINGDFLELWQEKYGNIRRKYQRLFEALRNARRVIYVAGNHDAAVLKSAHDAERGNAMRLAEEHRINDDDLNGELKELLSRPEVKAASDDLISQRFGFALSEDFSENGIVVSGKTYYIDRKILGLKKELGEDLAAFILNKSFMDIQQNLSAMIPVDLGQKDDNNLMSVEIVPYYHDRFRGLFFEHGHIPDPFNYQSIVGRCIAWAVGKFEKMGWNNAGGKLSIALDKVSAVFSLIFPGIATGPVKAYAERVLALGAILRTIAQDPDGRLTIFFGHTHHAVDIGKGPLNTFSLAFNNAQYANTGTWSSAEEVRKRQTVAERWKKSIARPAMTAQAERPPVSDADFSRNKNWYDIDAHGTITLRNGFRAIEEHDSGLADKLEVIAAPPAQDEKSGVTRRDFLKGTLLAATALAIGLPSRKALADVQGVPNSPSIVTAQAGDRRLFMRDRLPDGSLTDTYGFVARGVNWSPASIGIDPDSNPTGYRQEFYNWYLTDIPKMAEMGVNVVRVYHDFGTGSEAIAILDELYKHGIKVIMPVDSPYHGNVANLSNVSAVVNAYKNHPAILMWAVGNEWDLNYYYGTYTTLTDAAAFTESAAQLIKSLDANHPVATLIGDPHIPKYSDTAPYHPLSQEAFPFLVGPYTKDIVNTMAPSIDVWGLNIYRNSSFTDVFQQWKSISNKPMFIGEFGCDAYDHRVTSENQAMQDAMDKGLWDEAFFDLSALRTEGAAIGALRFTWNDEWWKNGTPSAHSITAETNSGQPDGYNDEEWFGVVDINRNPRSVFTSMQDRYLMKASSNVETDGQPLLTAASQQGGSWVKFNIGAKTVFSRDGGSGQGARGVNVAVLDDSTGIRMREVRSFDTWNPYGGPHTHFQALIDYLNSLPNGAVISIAIGDEGGFVNASNQPWNEPVVESAYQALEALGSTMIRSVGYGGGWAMIAIKGQGKLAENYSASHVPVSVQAQPSLTLAPDQGKRDLPYPPARILQTPSPRNGYELRFESRDWFVYEVQYTSDLKGTWQTAQTGIVASGTVTSWNDPGPTYPDTRFYKVMTVGSSFDLLAARSGGQREKYLAKRGAPGTLALGAAAISAISGASSENDDARLNGRGDTGQAEVCRKIAHDARGFIEKNKQAFWDRGLRITSCERHAYEVKRRLAEKGIGATVMHGVRGDEHHVWVLTDDGYIIDAYPRDNGAPRVFKAGSIDTDEYKGKDIISVEWAPREIDRWNAAAERLASASAGRTAPKDELTLFMSVIELYAPAGQPPAGSAEEGLLRLDLDQMRGLLKRPKLTWEGLRSLKSRANRMWRDLGSQLRLSTDNILHTASIVFNDDINAGFREFAAVCRAGIASCRKDIENGRFDRPRIVAMLEDIRKAHTRLYLNHRNQGPANEPSLDAITGLFSISSFPGLDKADKVIALSAITESEKSLAELERLADAGMFADSWDARVTSGVYDSSRVLGAQPGAASSKSTRRAYEYPRSGEGDGPGMLDDMAEASVETGMSFDGRKRAVTKYIMENDESMSAPTAGLKGVLKKYSIKIVPAKRGKGGLRELADALAKDGTRPQKKFVPEKTVAQVKADAAKVIGMAREEINRLRTEAGLAMSRERFADAAALNEKIVAVTKEAIDHADEPSLKDRLQKMADFHIEKAENARQLQVAKDKRLQDKLRSEQKEAYQEAERQKALKDEAERGRQAKEWQESRPAQERLLVTRKTEVIALFEEAESRLNSLDFEDFPGINNIRDIREAASAIKAFKEFGEKFGDDAVLTAGFEELESVIRSIEELYAEWRREQDELITVVTMDPNELLARIGSARAKLAKGEALKPEERLKSLEDSFQAVKASLMGSLEKRETFTDEDAKAIDLLKQIQKELAAVSAAGNRRFGGPSGGEDLSWLYPKAAPFITPDMAAADLLQALPADILALMPDNKKAAWADQIIGMRARRASEALRERNAAQTTAPRPAKARKITARENKRSEARHITKHFVKGQKLYRQGRTAEAIDEFETVFSLAPQNIWTLLYLVPALIDADRFDDALMYAEAGLHIPDRSTHGAGMNKPEFKAGLLCFETHCYIHKGEFSKAIEACRMAWKFDPQNVDVRRHLAEVYLDQSDTLRNAEQAEERLTMAVEQAKAGQAEAAKLGNAEKRADLIAKFKTIERVASSKLNKLKYRSASEDAASQEQRRGFGRNEPREKDELALFISAIELYAPAGQPPEGSAEEGLLRLDLDQMRGLLKRPKLTWEGLRSLKSRANRMWRDLGSQLRLSTDNILHTASIVFNDDINAGFREFAAVCRAGIASCRKDIENGRFDRPRIVAMLEDIRKAHTRLYLNHRNQGPANEPSLDAITGLFSISSFPGLDKADKVIALSAITESEKSLAELERLADAGMFADSWDARVTSGVYDSSRVLGAVKGHGAESEASPAPKMAGVNLKSFNPEVSSPDTPMWPGPDDLIDLHTRKTAKADAARIQAIKFTDAVKIMQGAKQKEPVILALGTGWIKGLSSDDSQLRGALNVHISQIRNYCNDHGIIFIDRDDSALLAEIEKARAAHPNARVVVLAKEETVTSKEFAPLRDNEKAFLAGVNASGLDETCYMRITEMLMMALRLGLRDLFVNSAPLDCPAVKAEAIQAFRNVYRFLPAAEKIPVDTKFKKLYPVEQFA